MDFHLTEPVLVIGIGGAGSKLASKAKESLHCDCLLISNDQNDFESNCSNVIIPTNSIINPSAHLIRGLSYQIHDQIQDGVSKYSTVIIMANLAGKVGIALSPIVSNICKEGNKNVISFVIMPFKYENDKIFRAGISLKRLRVNSGCTVVLDNDALLDSNPDLTQSQCYEISNNAIMHVIHSLKSSAIPSNTNILSTSKNGQDMEASLKDSLKMLYEDAPPTSVKRSMLYVLGGDNVPVGVLNSVTKIASGIFQEDSARVNLSVSPSEKSSVVMVSSIQGETRFDKYDPLGIIPSENTLDWDEPECSIDCKLDLDQLE